MPVSTYLPLYIKAKALAHNLQTILKLIPHPKRQLTTICIPVKANAYGCGVQPIIEFIKKNSFKIKNKIILGVANPLEGKYLRDLKWDKEILLLGSFYEQHIPHIIEANLTPSITSITDINILKNKIKYLIPKKEKISTHIKLDVGMGRIGIKKEEINILKTKINKINQLNITGFFTHFPCADNQKKKHVTLKQIKLFQHIVNDIINNTYLKRENLTLHLSNSAAIQYFPEATFDMVRPGIMFYGYFQSLENKIQLEKKIHLKPCLQLEVKPINLRTLYKNDTISYDQLYKVQDEQINVGVLPIGYADGIPVQLSNHPHILFEGKYPLLGKVTMDQIVLGGINNKRPISILGNKSPSLELWAKLNNTMTYEIMTHLGNRFSRVLI